MDDTFQWCNSFMLVPKENGKVRLYLDPARLNKAQIRPLHRGPLINDILLRLEGMKYLTLRHASSGHCNFKLYEKSSYITFS